MRAVEIAPRLLRRFGGYRGQPPDAALGMFHESAGESMSTIHLSWFCESCGPEGEKLIEYVEKERKHQPHVGELPLDIVAQTEAHGDKAVVCHRCRS